MSRNCFDCAHLEWAEGEIGEPAGWVCGGRKYRNDKEEEKHLEQLDNDAYLSRAKKCSKVIADD